MIATRAANSIIEAINENLHDTNLVKECVPGFLPNVKQLEQQWKQTTQEKEEDIKHLTTLNWETYW